MHSHSKISPLFPKTIALSSPYNHQDFLCKNPKLLFNLYLNSIFEDQPRQFDPKVQEQKELVKIFKGLKYIKKIRQNDLALSRIKLPASKTKDIIKRAQRVKVLDIQDKLTRAKSSPARLDLWLKYGKSLKNVNYQFAAGVFGVQTSIPFIEREVHQCLKFLPQHRDLSAFQIRLPISSPTTLESVLQFQRYPTSLKNFVIYQQYSKDPEISNYNHVVSAFSRLRNLESLTLEGERMLEMVRILLGKVPSLLNLKKLNVQVLEIHSFSRKFNLIECQTLKNLQHLKISNITKGEDLSKLTNPPQLKTLDITAGVELQGFELISQFLPLFSKSLTSLKFEIIHCYEAQTEEKINTLFSKINELEMLTSFKFKFHESYPAYGKEILYLSPEIIENLVGLFMKPLKLESFEWEVPRISGSGIFLDLLKFLEGSCGTLRKLKIVHPIMDLEKSQKVWLFNFLRRLERIEVLRLTGFDIKEQSFWADLVDSFLRMSLLRFLEIGEVTSGSQEEWFIKPLETILKKRGLEVLRIGMASGSGIRGIKQLLDVKEIMKANPALKEVSNNIRKLLKTAGFK